MSDLQPYRWWLLDKDLTIVSDGSVGGRSLSAALADVSSEIDRLGERGKYPIKAGRPYSLIVCQGVAVVAVRPSTMGIC